MGCWPAFNHGFPACHLTFLCSGKPLQVVLSLSGPHCWKQSTQLSGDHGVPHQTQELRLIIDGASSIGVGFVLFQYLDDKKPEKGSLIINTNSSMLSEQQVGYSPIDSELIGLDFACKACHYWLYHCPLVRLYSNCSSLLDMKAPENTHANSKLQFCGRAHCRER